MGRIGPGELLLIAVIFLLLFGASRLSDIGKGLADGIRNFKRGIKDEDDEKPKQLDEGKSAKNEETKRDADARV